MEPLSISHKSRACAGFITAGAILLCCFTSAASADPSNNMAVIGLMAPAIAQDAIEPGGELASIDDDLRFVPTTRPIVPEAQHPPLSNEKNVDTGKPIHEWQRATDDWLGLRPWLDDRGITFQANLTTDYSYDLRGGANPHASALRELFNANVTFNTERLFGLKGGTFYINFQNFSGENGAHDVGALQVADNIDGPSRTQISEAWYEQVLLDGKLRVKAGKIDASSEFATAKNSEEFLNSSFGESPTILGFPTYPDPAFGGNIFVYPNDHFYAGMGIYDGATQAGIPTGDRGPATLFGSPSDLFLIGEAGVKWTMSKSLPGRLGLGYWHHTGTFDRFDGGFAHGTSGPYAVVDQALWRADPDKDDDSRGIDMSLQYGHADSRLSAITEEAGASLTWTGMLPRRENDVVGVGVAWAGLSNERGAGFEDHAEFVAEAFYKFQLLKWLSVKPDLQFIPDAGGGRKSDAIVGTIRISIDF